MGQDKWFQSCNHKKVCLRQCSQNFKLSSQLFSSLMKKKEKKNRKKKTEANFLLCLLLATTLV